MKFYLKISTTAPLPLGQIVDIYCIATWGELSKDWYLPNWCPPNDVFFLSFHEDMPRRMSMSEQRIYENNVMDEIQKEKGFLDKVDYSRIGKFMWIFREYRRIDESLSEFIHTFGVGEEKPELITDENSHQYLERFLKSTFTIFATE